jgi:hypothetical protein
VYEANLEARLGNPAHVKFMGFALGAEDLIRMLEKQRQYRNVTLLNSLADASDKTRERFNITADWAPQDSIALQTSARAADHDLTRAVPQ